MHALQRKQPPMWGGCLEPLQRSGVCLAADPRNIPRRRARFNHRTERRGLMARHDQRGRSKTGGRFLQLHHFLMESAAWRSLKPQDRAVYLEIAALYDGKNNGRLALGVREAAERCNINKDTAGVAFQRLQDRGFIECSVPGGFTRKVRHATEWRLTQYRCDRTATLPTKAFMKWRPQDPECGPLVSDSRSPRFGQWGRESGFTVPSFPTEEAA